MGMALYYQHHWILDNMPVTWCYLVNEGGKTYCSTGFPMGCQVRKDLVSPFSYIIHKVQVLSVFNHNHLNLLPPMLYFRFYKYCIILRNYVLLSFYNS